MKFLVLFQRHYLQHTVVFAWSDCDGVLRVFSTAEQADESARRNRTAATNGHLVVPFADPTAWVLK